MDIRNMLSLPEGKTLEFKRDLTSLRPILKTLVAFSNTAGGTLIVGKNNDGTIIGVENVLLMEEKLANAISDSIYPPLLPEIEIASVDGRSLLVISVSHWRGPFYLKSQGETNGTYIRLGSTNRIAGPEMLEELKRSIMKVSFDQLPCPKTSNSSLDTERIKKAFSKIGKKMNQKTLETLGILVSYNGKLVCSNGGLILFGKDEFRKNYFPNSEVRCARFQGEDKVHFIDQYDVQGTILEAMDEVPKFIQRNTRLAAKIEKVRRRDIPEYSPIVIREILTNALAHADYSIRGMNPRIAIYSDRLEIESPGMLPFGYVLEDFFSGVSHIRNKIIARVFRELNIMEEWGTGYRRIHEICHAENYPVPVWEESGTTLRVISKPHQITQDKTVAKMPSEQDEFTPRQEEIIKLFEQHEILTTKEVYKKLKTSVAERTLRGDLLDLKEKKVIKMLGRGPSTYWKFIED